MLGNLEVNASELIFDTVHTLCLNLIVVVDEYLSERLTRTCSRFDIDKEDSRCVVLFGWNFGETERSTNVIVEESSKSSFRVSV